MRITIDAWTGVVVSVPAATRHGWGHPEERIEEFLRSRHSWLRRHLDRLELERAELVSRGGLSNGALLRYRGELHRLRIEAAGQGVSRSGVMREGVQLADELVVRLSGADRRPVASILGDWFRERARAAIDRAVVAHASAMGVRPTAVTLRDPRTRWGSASRRGRLSFSWRLVLAPPEALETVVVHELAHLRVFGHGQRFWDVVADRRPDHRTWRRWLHDHSTELHSALHVPAEIGSIGDPAVDAVTTNLDQAIA